MYHHFSQQQILNVNPLDAVIFAVYFLRVFPESPGIHCTSTTTSLKYYNMGIHDTKLCVVSLIYLSLLLLGSRTVWTEKVFLSEVVASQLFGFDVSNGLVTGRNPTKSLNLHPAHQILSCKMLI